MVGLTGRDDMTDIVPHGRRMSSFLILFSIANANRSEISAFPRDVLRARHSWFHPFHRQPRVQFTSFRFLLSGWGKRHMRLTAEANF